MESCVHAAGGKDGYSLSQSRTVRRGQNAERLQVRKVALAPCADDGGAGGESERCGRAAYGAGSALDEKRLAIQVAQGVDSSHSGGRREPCCRCLCRGPAFRDGAPRGQDRELRRGVADSAQTKHDVTHLRVRHTRTNLIDDADSVSARDRGQSQRQDLHEMPGAKENIDRIDARSVHLDPNRTLNGVRFWSVLHDQDVGGSVRVEMGGAHASSAFWLGMAQQILAAERNASTNRFRGKQGTIKPVPAADRLSPQEDRTWSLLVGVMMWLPAELDVYLERSADLSHAEYGVLRCLSLSEDREVHMSRLAATASVTPSHLSRIVGRLEKRRLLTRSVDPTDARKTLARLTESGARLLADVEPGYVAEVRARVFDLLEGEQLNQLEDVAEAILTPLRSDCINLLPPRSPR